MPKSETTVMLITVISTVWTHNLAIGVALGVVAAMVAFANHVAHFVHVARDVSEVEDRSTACYTVDGELFFASSNDLCTMFNYAEDTDNVVIDMEHSHPWDASTIAALDSVTDKYNNQGKHIDIVGLNKASRSMRVRLGGLTRSGDLPLLEDFQGSYALCSQVGFCLDPDRQVGMRSTSS